MSMRQASVAVMTALLLFSCAQPEKEEAPVESATAVQETGPDPVAVDSNHYSAEFENDRVRIVRIAYGPGEESVMHYHPQSVAVYLTDANVEMVLPDGSTMSLQSEAGQHAFADAGQHQPTNVSEQALELVQVELKGGATGAETPADQDPAAVDPTHYSVELENDLVRIVRITYGPGEESVMHYHPDSVAIFLTDQATLMTMPDGSAEEMQAAAGDAMFIPAGQHLPKNVSDSGLELILVELE